MKDIDQILNIAFISHGGAGKTSLAEAVLYLAGVTNRLGSVDEATSILDFEPEEVKRQTSLSSAFHQYPWKKKIISFIDTPGDENFINDTKTCLQGVDGAVLLVDAVDGVKVGTERVWEFAEDRELARLVFVNKMDRERADFFKVVNELSEAFELKCVPVNVPIGAEHDFKGIVNLLDEKAYIYEEGTGKFNQTDVPEDLIETVESWREQLIENIAETDDDLLEKYLDAGELSPEEINRGLINGVKSGSLAPVCCGTGTKMIGVSHLLDLINNVLPSPAERGGMSGVDPKDDTEISRNPSTDEPFSGLVIKTITDPFAGQLSILRVFSGSLKPDSTFFNSSKEAKERFG